MSDELKAFTHHSSLITHHLILMDFNLSKPQRLLKESAREFLARECGPGRVRALTETDTAHGGKLFVPDADAADLLVCVARDDDGLALLPVERGAAGLSVKATPSMDATRKLYEVAFDGARVAAGDALGADGDARAALRGALEVA